MEPNQNQSITEKHIDVIPGVRSGKPLVKGTRVAVSDVVLWTEQGMSADELVMQFPQLSLSDVYAALAYYHDNRGAMDRQISESELFSSTIDPTSKGQDASDNSVSS